MVLGWLNGENTVIKEILDKIVKLENKVKLLESENAAQKEEILAMRNGNACTEWSDVLIGKKKKLQQNQRIIVDVVETERNDRDNRDHNVVLFKVPVSKAAPDEERKIEDEMTTFSILKEIGMSKDNVKEIKRFKANPKKTATSKPLHVRITLKYISDVNITLKKAKALKDSVKFKSVFFNKDLTTAQIDRLKQLIKTRNSENAKLDAKNTDFT